MQRQQQSEEAINKEELRRSIFHKALFGLHGDLDAMKKDEANPYFKSKYVSLPNMLKILKPLFQKHGFILNQPVDVANTQNGMINAVVTRLVHVETGLSEESKIMLPSIDDMQKLGGAITYARRYTLSAVLGLEERDDDGETAVGRGYSKTTKKSTVKSKDKF